jgi:hypothetical protein
MLHAPYYNTYIANRLQKTNPSAYTHTSWALGKYMKVKVGSWAPEVLLASVDLRQGTRDTHYT